VTPLRPVLSSRHYAIGTFLFLLFVLYGSLVPLEAHHLSLNDAIDRFSLVMSRPVSFQYRSDWAANVILFVPLGFLSAGAVAVDRHRPLAIIALIPMMTTLSAGIEFLQLWFPARDCSINDVAAETVGGIIGVGAWWIAGQWTTIRARAAWADLGPGDWAAKALPGYLVVLVFVHGMPFDLSISPYQLKQKYTRGQEPDAEAEGTPRIAFAPFPAQLGEHLLLELVYFMPVGALLARLPGRHWRNRQAAGRVLASGLAVAGGVEAVQFIVMSCSAYAADVVSGSLFVLAGWWLSCLRYPIAPRTWAAFGFAWCLALMLVFWAPFDGNTAQFAVRVSKIEWVPFVDYFEGNYVAAYNCILNKTVLFVPVGFLLGRARPGAVWIGWVIGGALSLTIELGQAAWTTHRSSTSDVMIGMIGGGLGAVLAGRISQGPSAVQHVAITIDDKQVAKWREHYRQSIRVLPVVLCFAIALCLGLLVVNLIVALPTWLDAIVAGVAAFSVIGEAINVVYLGRKLDRVERGK
jgi:glycopeptide antibiotics resistance protein